MGEILLTMLVICIFVMFSCGWRAFNWVWLKPKKLEKCLNEQGIKGLPYKFFYGNIEEMTSSVKEARSKPTEYSHQILPRVMPFIHRMAKDYGKISIAWIGPVPRLIIVDLDMIKDILSDKFGYIRKIKLNFFGKTLVTGIVTHEGEKWAKHRKIIVPAFHQDKLKIMLPAFYTSGSEMLNKWEKLVQDGSCELDVWPDLKNLAADVISRVAFGSSYEEGQRIFQLQTEQASLFLKSTQSMYIPGSRFLPTKRNKRMNEICREIQTLLRDLIFKRQNAMKTGELYKDDLLGMLMESNFKEIKDNGNSKSVGMSIDDVVDECKLFYFAGQETTSNLLVWTMIVLSKNRDWQEKAREEVLQVFGRKKPDFDGLSNLKIVTMILNEVLRLYAPAPTLLRVTYKEIKLGEVVVPPGVELLVPSLVVHHDHELWGEDAEEFNPARFSEGISKATKNKLSFFPFGWGPRICIGQSFTMIEAKMVMAMILQHFSFELSSTYIHAPNMVLTLQPLHGAQLILHKL